MVLQCECGGAIEITEQSYGVNVAFEKYECVACGRTGTYSFGNGQERASGCVTIN